MTIILSMAVGVLFCICLFNEFRISNARKIIKEQKSLKFKIIKDSTEAIIASFGKMIELEVKLKEANEKIKELEEDKKNTTRNNKSVASNGKRKK